MFVYVKAERPVRAQVRTEAYRDFLLNNPSLVKDKVRAPRPAPLLRAPAQGGDDDTRLLSGFH